MIVADFDYHRPSTIEEAMAELARQPSVTAVLAGGQSLIPAMKAGERAPTVLVDIAGLAGLDGISVSGDALVVGALVRHHDLATNPVVRQLAPLLAQAAGSLADPQVRYRGTIGGSLAHADPAADLPLALLALDATVLIHGPAGPRRLPIAEFTRGAYATVLGPGELVTGVRVPRAERSGWSHQKFHRDALEWAVVAVAAVRDPAGAVRLAIGNLAERPVLAQAVMVELARGAPAGEAARRAAEGVDARPDHRASAAYRRYVAEVLTVRALRELGCE